MKYTTIIFDMDGTLLDTNEVLKDLFFDTTKYFDITVTPEFNYEENLGVDVHELISNAFPQHIKNKNFSDDFVKQLVSNYNESVWKEKVAPFSGIKTLLTKLQSQSLNLAVLSNSPNDVVNRMIEMYFPDTFTFVYGESKINPKKPSPNGIQNLINKFDTDTSNTVLIGDSLVDCQTSINAGIDMIGAGWDASIAVDNLIQSKKCPIAKTPNDLLKQLAIF